MSCQRVITDDKLLFRILKSKNCDISIICDKMVCLHFIYSLLFIVIIYFIPLLKII